MSPTERQSPPSVAAGSAKTLASVDHKPTTCDCGGVWQDTPTGPLPCPTCAPRMHSRIVDNHKDPMHRWWTCEECTRRRGLRKGVCNDRRDKADQLLLTGRVAIVRASTNELRAIVYGDDARYAVTRDDRGRLRCECPALQPDCSHAIAVAMVTRPEVAA